jgi:hypothetical protein
MRNPADARPKDVGVHLSNMMVAPKGDEFTSRIFFVFRTVKL